MYYALLCYITLCYAVLKIILLYCSKVWGSPKKCNVSHECSTGLSSGDLGTPSETEYQLLLLPSVILNSLG